MVVIERMPARTSYGSALAYGVVAGIFMAVVEMIVAAAQGVSLLLPFRLFASILMGEAALAETPASSTVIVGLFTHVVLSGLFGVIYAALSRSLSPASRVSWGVQAGIGLAFGLALWLVNFQIIARAAYPWFLDANQVVQAIVHAACYGLPLALLVAATERYSPPIVTARPGYPGLAP